MNTMGEERERSEGERETRELQRSDYKNGSWNLSWTRKEGWEKVKNLRESDGVMDWRAQ